MFEKENKEIETRLGSQWHYDITAQMTASRHKVGYLPNGTKVCLKLLEVDFFFLTTKISVVNVIKMMVLVLCPPAPLRKINTYPLPL